MNQAQFAALEATQKLKSLGLAGQADLFSAIPNHLLFPNVLAPAALSEPELVNRLAQLAHKNRNAKNSNWFLGAGRYYHAIPELIHLYARQFELNAESATEGLSSNQTFLGLLLDLQSMISELFALETVYPALPSLAQTAKTVIAAIFDYAESQKLPTSKREVYIPAYLHPELKTIFPALVESRGGKAIFYTSPPKEASKALGNNCLAMLFAQPDFLGEVYELSTAIQQTHAGEALCAVFTDPLFLGLFRAPGQIGADIVMASAQALGTPPAYSGPQLSFLGVTEELTPFTRAGRVQAEAEGERLVWIDGGQANTDWHRAPEMVSSALYLAGYGASGLKETAHLIWNRSHYAASAISKIRQCTVKSRFFFQEFVVELPYQADAVSKLLEKNGIISGFPLSRIFPERANQLLICVTEMDDKDEIDFFITKLKELL
jgi:glycine dehydrogenase subunit 1